MIYTGAVAYREQKQTTTKVTHLEFIGVKYILLDWLNPAEAPSELVTRFLGVAERQVDGTYQTPWVYLTDEAGKEVAEEWGARITFTITDHNASQLGIDGNWTDFEGTRYPFFGMLSRAGHPTPSGDQLG